MQLAEKVAIVTGGASGIGRAIALRFAREGSNVVVADLNTHAADAVVNEIGQTNGDAIRIHADVSDAADMRRVADACAERWDGLHIVVNCAGVDAIAALSELSVEDFDRTIAVDLRSAFLSAKLSAGAITRSGGGSILNIASVMAWYASPGSSAYTAAKAGMIGLTRALALELGAFGIRVNAIAPGYIDTPIWQATMAQEAHPEVHAERIRRMHPLGRRGLPEDVAAAAVFLCSQDADFITGQTLVVDGGVTTQLRPRDHGLDSLASSSYEDCI